MRALIFLLLVLLSSCSVFKNRNRDRQKTDVQTEAKAEENKTTETKTEGKAKTVITETTEGTIDLAGERLQGHSNDLKTDPIIITGKDFTTVVKDSAGVKTATTTIRPRKIQTKTEKRTEREEETKQIKKEKSDSVGENSVKVKTDNLHQDREVKKTGLLIARYWWLLIIVAIGCGLAWRFRKGIF